MGHQPLLLSRRPPPWLRPPCHQPPPRPLCLQRNPLCPQRSPLCPQRNPLCRQRSPQLLCLRKLPQLKLVPPCIDTTPIYNNWLYQAFLLCPVLNKILTLV